MRYQREKGTKSRNVAKGNSKAHEARYLYHPDGTERLDTARTHIPQGAITELDLRELISCEHEAGSGSTVAR